MFPFFASFHTNNVILKHNAIGVDGNLKLQRQGNIFIHNIETHSFMQIIHVTILFVEAEYNRFVAILLRTLDDFHFVIFTQCALLARNFYSQRYDRQIKTD